MALRQIARYAAGEEGLHIEISPCAPPANGWYGLLAKIGPAIIKLAEAMSGKTPGDHAETGARMSSAKLGTAGTPGRLPG